MSEVEEHRHTDRRTLTQEVMLSSGRKFQLCKVRDISSTGVQLGAAWAGLISGANVEITMDLHTSGGDMKSYRIPGTVARVDTMGTAIKFDQLEGQTSEALTSFLNNLS